jgi:hypothetical protein
MRSTNFFMWLWLLILAICLSFALGCGKGGDDDNGVQGNDDDTTTDDDSSPADDDDDNDASPDDDTSPIDDDTSPADDDDSPSPADPFCEAGKQMLLAGEGGLAAPQFLSGLSLDTGAWRCRYGLALADTLRQFDVISILVAYVESFLEGYIPPGKDAPQTGQGFIDEILNRIAGGLMVEEADEAIAQVEWLRTNRPGVVYPLEHLPIILNFEAVADPHGDYDLTDGVAVQAFSGMPAGLAEHLTAMNFDFELGIVLSVMDIDFSQPFDQVAGQIVDILLELFDNPLFPDFFTLKDSGDPYKAAGLKLGLGFLHARETYDLMVAPGETGEQEVLGYDDLNGNLQWDSNEPYVVPPWGALDYGQNQTAIAFRDIFGHLANSFLDYTTYDSDPANPQPFKLSYLNPLLVALGLPALIPDWDSLSIDFGASYRDADPTSLRDSIVAVLNLLDAILP